jgi:hypothetical protein
VRYEPTFSAGERLHSYALDRAVTGTDTTITITNTNTIAATTNTTTTTTTNNKNNNNNSNNNNNKNNNISMPHLYNLPVKFTIETNYSTSTKHTQFTDTDIQTHRFISRSEGESA